MRTTLSRSGRWLAVTALALSASGCDLFAPDVWEERREALEHNRDRWRRWGVHAYAYTVSRTCFCLFTGPMEITVTEGVVTSVTPLREDVVVGEDQWPSFPTVEDLFSVIESAIESRVDRLEATYDATFGHPTRIAIDHWQETVDDELLIRVTDLEVVEPE